MPVARFIGTIFITLTLTTSYCQSTERLISNIRTEFKRINTEAKLRTTELNNEEFLEHMTDGGGSLTGYFENGRLVKFVEWIGLSFGNLETEYYLKNDELFFAYQEVRRYADKEGGLPAEFDYSKLITVLEGRYYFNDGELIKEIEKGTETKKRIFSNKFEEEKFLQQAKNRAKQLRDKYEN